MIMQRNCCEIDMVPAEKNEFGILGIQVAGEMMHLNVLIKDTDDAHQLFCLRSIEIPVQPMGKDMQSEIDDSSKIDSSKQCIIELEAKNNKIKAENVELKARIVKLEDKQLQNELIKNLLSVP
ncbi:hypothetical protein RhiirA4_547768 [Rhizophagus irregularis]|uniref:Uncharacterized protein n=1 Tax=Rhizophagus irregularis TaxID=588596 RepID=A0A2I1H478_9GLOM|nr:hypothetical protein RhiirA4_547768 [Rhizophagus irregularis]